MVVSKFFVDSFIIYCDVIKEVTFQFTH